MFKHLTHLNKRTIGIFIVSSTGFILTVVIVIQLTGIGRSSSPSDTGNPLEIKDVVFVLDSYAPNQSLDVSVTIVNHSELETELWLGLSLQNPLGEWLDIPLTEISMNSTDERTVQLTPILEDLSTDPLISGSYSAVFSLWDSNPITDTSNRLATFESNEAFRLYQTLETFETIDESIWFSREGTLGRTHLSEERVDIKNDLLTITMPENTLNGGEIQTLDLVHYGSYEIRMKLPHAPSSITGFFLYKAPDFHHEIDIEVFNQPEADVLFTTYSGGSVQHEAKAPLPFDPTATFHNYRIDYYPNKVSFYIDDQLFASWTDGFSQEPMHLMVNTWFPSWLDGIPPSENQTLEIEWIRY